jgi:hypothetical protein
MAALGAVLVFGAAGCSSSPARSVAPPATSPTTTTRSASQTLTQSGGASSTSSTSAPRSTTSTSAPGLQNLTVTDAVRTQLTTAFVAYKHLDPSEITGTVQNSVYYAYDPSTQTYWALASFVPSTTAPQQVLVGMQDGGADGYFKMVGGGAWQVSLGEYPSICGEQKFFPPTVISLWSLSTEAAGNC